MTDKAEFCGCDSLRSFNVLCWDMLPMALETGIIWGYSVMVLGTEYRMREVSGS